MPSTEGDAATDLEQIDLHTDDSPATRRQKLANRPNYKQLKSWRARKRRLELQRYNIETGRIQPRTVSEIEYLESFITDLQAAICSAELTNEGL